jgi:hypothetical protein
MVRNPKVVKLSLALLASLLCSGAFLSIPKPAGACVPVCDWGWCCCGKVSAVDSCTGRHVCVSFCAF